MLMFPLSTEQKLIHYKRCNLTHLHVQYVINVGGFRCTKSKNTFKTNEKSACRSRSPEASLQLKMAVLIEIMCTSIEIATQRRLKIK